MLSKTRINFRSGPSTSFEKAGETLNKNEKVLVFAKVNEWYQVEQQISGWVYKEYIDRDNSDAIYDGVVSANVLNIRDKPGGAKVAKPLSKGHKVMIFRQQRGWYEVETRVIGWVSAKYIELV